MSYLHLPRLIFTGDFKSDVSTVNNVTPYYNNPTFNSSFQQSPKGLWNPEGGASFAFVDCKVEQIMLPDGAEHANEIIIGCTVGAPEDKSPGKMVDLDPQQQMVSQLWAVTLRIATAQDELLFQGDIKPVGFRDLQLRQTDSAPNGQPMGATWTSVLTNVEWGEKASSSPFLTKLKSVTQGDKLSLNLNSFGYYYAHLDGRFSLGHTLGSIGPWFEDEPDLFAPARRLYGVFAAGAQQSVYFNFSNFLFEKANKRLTIDFGGSFPVADAIGTIDNPAIPDGGQILQNPQQFLVAVINKPIDNQQDTAAQIFTKDDFVEIGELKYETGNDWLNKTGGIVVFDNLSDEVTNQLVNNQLVLLSPSASSSEQYVLIAREAINGYVVRADDFVQRLDYNQTNKTAFYAYQWGEPLAAQAIEIALEPPTNPKPNRIKEIPGIGSPPNGLTFSPAVTTDADGRASLDITGNAIHNPRGYIDGQIYKLDYRLQNIPTDPLADSMLPENISIHLRDYFEVPENPAWSDISEIMTQYSDLYPIMSKYIVDLKDPHAVKAKKDILIFAFTRDITDPIHMPVTRDLSEARREAIIKWLEAPDLKLGEKPADLDKSEEKSAGFDKSLESDLTAEPETQLTEKQIRLEKLERSKSGVDFFNQMTERPEDQ